MNMKKASSIGKKHVLDVSYALKRAILNKTIDDYNNTVIETVKYILNLYPEIQSVKCKLDMPNSDEHPDLTLRLKNKTEVKIELFLIRGTAAIQPKNLGAKSFFKKYFKSKDLQIYFNDFLNNSYKEFLSNVVATKEKPELYDTIPILRNKVSYYYPRFTDEINPYRTSFLFELREYCFELLKNEYNGGALGIAEAFNELMLTDTVNIITRYTKGNKRLSVERWEANVNLCEEIQIYKKGNDTVGIRLGTEALTLRFKFESAPNSSIKLATSYETFPEKNKIIEENLVSVSEFERIINEHKQQKTKNKSNAIGKCNEAMIYYRILKTNLRINQVDEQSFVEMLNKYAPKITQKDLLDIKLSSKITISKVYAYLQNKYNNFNIDSIQLVGDSYIQNRLDTSDLQLILKVDKKYIVESFSLKAIAKWNSKITTKNPGIGQILGPKYFDIGSISLVVKKVKDRYKNNELNHQESLEIVSEELGKKLVEAPQDKLKKGIISLLGNSTVVLTIYTQNESVILDFDTIKDKIRVLSKTPSPIQTTLLWNRDKEELTLRVKFSANQSKGWSSLKLACDYKVVR